jgi:hypothetical protein
VLFEEGLHVFVGRLVGVDDTACDDGAVEEADKVDPGGLRSLFTVSSDYLDLRG